ncbi:MAG: hypothetical protein QOG15_1610 [Solirubrobacteraceae bacterium]|jgi:hypothetical protein|nr:hypothetical protein [Solirubrobacteraceae bacterium]
MHRALTIVVLAALALLAACGSASDEERIGALIRKSATSKDPRVCSGGTESLLAQTSFGNSAVAKLNESYCRANIKTLTPDSVAVSSVKVTGDTAEATYTTTGGALGYDRATIELTDDGGSWRVKRFKAIRLNRAQFDASTLKQLTSPPDALAPAAGRCFIRVLHTRSDRELERRLLAADPGFMVEPAIRCAMVPELRKAGVTGPTRRCIVGRLLARTPKRVAEILFEAGFGSSARGKRLMKRVIRECV